MAYKTIILDLDGTLLDTLVDLMNSVNHTLTHYGCPKRSIDEIRSFVGNGVKVLLKRSFPYELSEAKAEEALEVFREHYAVHLNDHTKPYDGILSMLDSLNHAGYYTAIVSNKLHSAVCDLNDRYFKGYVSLAIGTPPESKKPDPYCVNQVMNYYHCNTKETIYVGDSEVDIQTARNANIPCIAVTWGFRDRDFLADHKPDYMVDHPDELLALIKRLS